MELSGYLLTKRGGSEIYDITVSGSTSFVRQLWGGGINSDRTAVLMSVGYRVIHFRNGSWILVNPDRVGGVNNDAS